jgi:hypothetical protein
MLLGASAWPAPEVDVSAGTSPDGLTTLGDLLSGASPFKESARRMAVSVGLVDASQQILGPYSDIAARVTDALYEAVLPGSRSATLYWPLLGKIR